MSYLYSYLHTYLDYYNFSSNGRFYFYINYFMGYVNSLMTTPFSSFA